MATSNRCPVCDGGTCAVCYWSGTDTNLQWPVPADHLRSPWELFPRDALVLFLQRAYEAGLSTVPQFAEITRSLYSVAEYGFRAGGAKDPA